MGEGPGGSARPLSDHRRTVSTPIPQTPPIRAMSGASNVHASNQSATPRRWSIPRSLRLPLLALTVTSATAALLLTRVSSRSPVLELLAVLAALVAATAIVLLLGSWLLGFLTVAAAYFLVPVLPPGLDRVAAVVEQIECDRRVAADSALRTAIRGGGNPHSPASSLAWTR